MKGCSFLLLLSLLHLTVIPIAVAQSPGGKPVKKEDKVTKPEKPKPDKPVKPEKPLTAENLTGVWTRGMEKGWRAIRFYGKGQMSLTVWDSNTRTVIYHSGGGWESQGMQSFDGRSFSSPGRPPDWLISSTQTVAFRGANSCSLLDAQKGGTPESWGRVSAPLLTPVAGEKPPLAAELTGVWERNLPGARKATKWYGCGRVCMTVYVTDNAIVLEHYEGTWQVEGNRSIETLECATKEHLKLLEKPIVHRVAFQAEKRCRLNNVDGGPQEEWTRVVKP